MHKRLLNEAIIDLTIAPAGPMLIKAGESGADPTRPDMEFVRTHYDGRRTVYLPGSSLKGVIRSHCERIARTLGGQRLSCDPLDPQTSCGAALNRWDDKKQGTLNSQRIHKESCFICRLFGNTSLASHIRFGDAYPLLPPDYEGLSEHAKRQVDPNFTEERDGVAIDRVFGSVAVGPFQFEVVTRGRFGTKIHVTNFTIPQLGLVGLALRDLARQEVVLGFAKSRGLGTVEATVNSVRLRYPTCRLEDGEIVTLLGQSLGPDSRAYGVGQFSIVEEGYGYSRDDEVALSDRARYCSDEWGEVHVELTGADLDPFWIACVEHWKQEVDAG